MNQETLHAIRDHAESDPAREVCGLVVADADGSGERVLRSRNMADNPHASFMLDTDTMLEGEECGILAVYHSHPRTSQKPSLIDLASCQTFQVEFIIYSPWTRRFHFEQPKPKWWPILGRDWKWGENDCLGAVESFYQMQFGVKLPYVPRPAERQGTYPFAENAHRLGFRRLDDTEPARFGDVLELRVHSDKPNHLAVVLGDELLHHLVTCLAEKVDYSGYWKRRTVSRYRHESRDGDHV